MRLKEKPKKGGVKERKKVRERSKMISDRKYLIRREYSDKIQTGLKYYFNEDLGISDDKPVLINTITASLFTKSYSSKELISTYMQYPSFRRVIESGDYLLYNKRIRFASKEVKDLVVKDWVESVAKGLSYGGGDDGDDFDPEKVDKKTKMLMEMMDSFFKEPHDSFSSALKFIMEFLNVSGAKLSSMTGINTSTISKMLHEDKYNTPRHEEKTIVVICLALKVPPMISEELLRLAGCPLSKSNELHRAYLILLNFFYLDGLKVCNNFLITRKLPRIVN